MRLSILLAGTTALALLAPATQAQQAQTREPDNAFALGQIIVTAPRLQGAALSGSTIKADAIRLFNRDSVDEAAKLIPGVTATNSGGSRNERMVNVRGFDRFQVPLSIDGIRVYLPADNRLDYGRFVTPDIAEIQVAKGYASVLDGPGAMGGAINLVTRKPVQPVEAEARATLNLDRSLGHAGESLFALLGSRQEKWYVQGSYTRNATDHWDLAGGFTATPTEDGGARDFSRTRDTRLNTKIGFTPNDTDEYSLSYTRQTGSKNAPLHVSDPVSTQRFWTWPDWDIDSLYFLSSTALGDRVTVKTRLFRNNFDNLLRAFDNRSQNSQTLGRAFNSYYDDEAYGGSVQMDIAVASFDTLSLAAHYRRDRHVEWQQAFPSGATEPKQTNLEDTYSLAAENRLALAPALTLVLGASMDWRDLRRAEEYGTVPGQTGSRLFSYPIADADAVNGQGKLIWTPDAQSSLYGAISSRTRFPTVFERFSSRFGGAISNPDLKAERATHYEIGGNRRFGMVEAEAALFYSHIDDAIVAFPFIYQTCTSGGVCTDNAVTQSRNLGSGDYSGLELAMTATLADGLALGVNYTYTHRDLDDPSNRAFRPTGVPAHKGFLYADWSPVEKLRIVPNLELVSDRWTVNTAGTRYYRTGSHVLAGLRADYALTDRVEIGLGGRNLLDRNYALTDGFPEAGRSFFATIRATY